MAVSQRQWNLRRHGLVVEVWDRTRHGVNTSAAAELAALVLRSEGAARAEVGITFVGARRMRVLNREHRGVDRVTDVLSFPLEEADELAAGAAAGAAGASGVDQTEAAAGDETGGPPRLLGDVVVCVWQAARQAAADGNPLAFEVALLLVHGTLHLLGWEHDEQPGAMALRQAELLQRFDWSHLA